MKKNKLIEISFFLILFAVSSILLQSTEKRKFTVEDAMKFPSLKGTKLSDNGSWLAYYLEPDRGDPKGFVQITAPDSVKYSVERGINPEFTNDANWVSFLIKPKAIEFDNAEKDKPKNGAAIISTKTGEIFKFENVKSYAFSEDSKWFVYKHFEEEAKSNSNKKKALWLIDMRKDLSDHNLCQLRF